VNAFTAVFELVDGWWLGSVEELPGANVQAKTIDEARHDLQEAVELVLAANRDLARQDSEGRQVVREEFILATKRAA
jgi:predicted RNase H-like HicB family nuclease